MAIAKAVGTDTVHDALLALRVHWQGGQYLGGHLGADDGVANRAVAIILQGPADVMQISGGFQYLHIGLFLRPDSATQSVNPQRVLPVVAAGSLGKALGRAAKEAVGVEARPMGIGGGTVAAVLRRRGFECAVWATQEGMAHQPDEYCLMGNLMGDAKVMARLFLGA